jgi:outer membrane cobalamin receptor
MTRRSIATAAAAAATAALCVARVALAQVPGELRGRVTNARTAQPVETAQIEVSGSPPVRSTPGGEYVVRGLDPGPHTVRVRALGFTSRRSDVEIANGRTTTLDLSLEPRAVALDPVTVFGIGDASARGAVQFDRAAIARSNKRDAGELLQTVPGVVITQSGGPGAPSRVSIRGSAANEVLVLVDGVPLNSPLDGEVDLSRLSLETAERVTVRTGAQSARYGPRALAGVIEIETRRPTREASVTARAGAWGERGSSLTLGDRRAIAHDLNGALSFTGDYRTARGDFRYEVPAVRGGGEADRLNADMTSRQLLGTASLEGRAWDARVRIAGSDLTRGMAGSIVQPSLTGRQSRRRLSGGFDTRGRHGVLSWTALADVSRDRATFNDPAPPFSARFDDTVRATGASGSASASAGDDATNASLGVDVRTLDVASTSLEADAPHWQRTTGTWGRVRVVRRARAGIQIDGEISGRLDQTSLIDGANFSPRVGLGATTSFATLSGSIGAGYAPPSLADQFFQEGVQVEPNPSLAPERTRRDIQGRLSIHERAIGALRAGAEAAAYRADVDGMILWMPDFRFVWSPSNFDVARSGWELGGHASLQAARLDAQASIARANVTYRGPVLSGQVVYRPRTTSTFTAGYSPGPFRLEATTRYAGSRRTAAGSDLNSLDPYWRTDVEASYTRRVRGWRIVAGLGVDNALDQPATMLVDYPFPGQAWWLSFRLQSDGAIR